MVQAVRGLSFDLNPGETMALVGESGSGKSVTSLAIMGLHPDSARIEGSIQLDGMELLGKPDDQMSKIRGKRIAMIFQDPLSSLHPYYKVGWQIGEMIRAHERNTSKKAARKRAIELLRKSAALPDATAQICNYLGYLLLERDEHFEEAGKLIRRAVESEPDNGAYLDSLGWYYYKTGDYPKAIEWLQKALEALPEKDPVVYEHLGDAHAAAADRGKAVEAWKKAAALPGASPALAEKIAGGEK